MILVGIKDQRICERKIPAIARRLDVGAAMHKQESGGSFGQGWALHPSACLQGASPSGTRYGPDTRTVGPRLFELRTKQYKKAIFGHRRHSSREQARRSVERHTVITNSNPPTLTKIEE